jgi:hypothetical protein
MTTAEWIHSHTIIRSQTFCGRIKMFKKINCSSPLLKRPPPLQGKSGLKKGGLSWRGHFSSILLSQNI